MPAADRLVVGRHRGAAPGARHLSHQVGDPGPGAGADVRQLLLDELAEREPVALGWGVEHRDHRVVGGVVAQDGGRRGHDLGAVARPDQGDHLGQRRQAPLPEHPLGGLGDGAEDASHPAGLVGDRAVGVGEVALLRVAVAVDDQPLVGRPGGTAAGHDLLEHRADDVPDLAPDLSARCAQRPRVLALPEHRPVGVVVDHHQLGPPPQQDGEARRQADADRGAQALRPVLRVAERAGRPVAGVDERRELAAGHTAGSPRRRRGAGSTRCGRVRSGA